MTHEATMEELQALKQQFALLNEKLEQQKIISREAVLENINERIAYIDRKRRIRQWFMIVGYPILPIPMMRFWDMPVGIYVLYYAMGIAALIATRQMFRRLDVPSLASASLIDAGKRVMRYERDVRRWRYFALPVALAFLIWVGYALSPAESNSTPIYAQIGMIVGAIIGGIFGIMEERKFARKLNEILQQIRNLEQ